MLLSTYPCSPYLLGEGMIGWLLFIALWAPWPVAFVNWRWAKRQRKFWNEIRERETERRKAKRSGPR